MFVFVNFDMEVETEEGMVVHKERKLLSSLLYSSQNPSLLSLDPSFQIVSFS